MLKVLYSVLNSSVLYCTVGNMATTIDMMEEDLEGILTVLLYSAAAIRVIRAIRAIEHIILKLFLQFDGESIKNPPCYGWEHTALHYNTVLCLRKPG